MARNNSALTVLSGLEPAVAVSVSELSHSIFSGFGLQISRGSTVALLGANGAGKSTLVRLLLGLEVPDCGTASCLGQVSYVPQDYGASLFPWLSVEDNAGLFLGSSSSPTHRRERSRHALSRFSIGPDLFDRLPNELSGGEQQLVALARALAPQPDVLLLDEAFSALDIAMRIDARRVISDLPSTVIFISHDLDDVFELADRVIVLRGSPARIVVDVNGVAARHRRADLHRIITEAVR